MSKKLSDYIPIFADQGIDYVAAAPAAGVSTQAQEVVVSGATHTVTLASQMANNTYTAIATNGTDGGSAVTIGTKTTTTVVIKNGSADDNVNLVVVGQLKGQS
jgi:hypothetical protein